MAKNKTTENQDSVAEFITAIADEQRRSDFATMVNLIAGHTQLEPKMWGSGIVGFGSYDYKYDSGHEGSAPLAAIAPRSASIAIYLLSNFENREALLAKFGKHKTDKGCVHIKKLEDINTEILLEMIKNTIVKRKEEYPD